MKYIHITKENIDKEHICCAMSGKQALAKKEWLKQRFDEGLVFYRSEERGKCFIEYIPAENAWVALHPLSEGFRLPEGTRLFLRTAVRVHPGRKRTGKERHLHSVRRGAEAGIFS